MNKSKDEQEHNISPVYDAESVILILGSFPSVKSRSDGFYYAHPRNRFWKTVAAVLGEKVPKTIEEKRIFLLAHKIALWDVVGRCEISASSDASIGNVCANDVETVLRDSNVKTVFTNGKTAYRLYNKYLAEKCMKEAIPLPSTSPAHASRSDEDLINEWRIICRYL